MLHSKINFRHYYPLTEVVGVFITAWSIGLCYVLCQGLDIYAYLLVCACVVYYGFDHWQDLQKLSDGYYLKYRRINLLTLVFASLIGLFIMVQSGFMQTLQAFYERFWPTVWISVAYVFLRRLHYAWVDYLKILLVALAVGLAVEVPSMGLKTVHAVLICVCNLMVFAYLERHKDELFGNRNVFQLGLKKRGLISFLIFLILLGIISDLFLDIQQGFGLTFYSFFSLMVVLSERKFRQNTYRWWLDALLPVAFLPIG